MSKSHSNKIIKKRTRVAGVLLGLQLDCYLPWGHCNLYLIIVLTFVFCIFLLHIATWTSNSIKDISSLFWHDILAWYFGIEFWHGKTCQNFQLEILGRYFGMKFHAESFGMFFPCQNFKPKFWHLAERIGLKSYFGGQMYRPRV